MRPFHLIVTMTLFLGLGFAAAKLIIYTEVEAKSPLTMITLKSDWTLDKTTKQQYLKDHGFEPMKIPGGKDTMFEVLGVMEWDSDCSDGKRAFWVSGEEEPYQKDGGIRQWHKCTVKSLKLLKKDVWVFLSHMDNEEDPSWTSKDKNDMPERNWLHCAGGNGDWDDKFFAKPDDTWS